MKFNAYVKYVLTVISVLFLSYILYSVNPVIGDGIAQVSNAVKKDLAQSITVNGTVTAKDKEEISVEKGKAIKKLFIEENGVVNKGDILFETDESDLMVDVKRKELELIDAQQELEDLKDMTLERENRDNELNLKELEFDITEKEKMWKSWKKDTILIRNYMKKDIYQKKI